MLYTSLDFRKSYSYVTSMGDTANIVGQEKLPSNGEITGLLRDTSYLSNFL